jgi:hypothetical protein
MVEICRIHSAALAHQTYGVNAQLANLPKYESDPEIPEIARVLDLTIDPEVILRKRPMDYPSLIVSMQNVANSDREFGDVYRDSRDVLVNIDIVVSATDPAPSARDVLYYIRAILRCLKDLMEPLHSDDQEQNGIQLVAMNAVDWGPVNIELPSGRIVGTVIPSYYIRDSLPSRTSQ